VTRPVWWGAVAGVLLAGGFLPDSEMTRVREALLHEMAHVKRRDYLTMASPAVVLPLVKLDTVATSSAEASRTSDMACDEMADREMSSELGYARDGDDGAEVMLAEGWRSGRSWACSRNNVMEERVMRLMEPDGAECSAKLVRLATGATAKAAGR